MSRKKEKPSKRAVRKRAAGMPEPPAEAESEPEPDVEDEAPPEEDDP
jgi:hypothetical protein